MCPRCAVCVSCMSCVSCACHVVSMPCTCHVVCMPCACWHVLCVSHECRACSHITRRQLVMQGLEVLKLWAAPFAELGEGWEFNKDRKRKCLYNLFTHISNEQIYYWNSEYFFINVINIFYAKKIHDVSGNRVTINGKLKNERRKELKQKKYSTTKKERRKLFWSCLRQHWRQNDLIRSETEYKIKKPLAQWKK